MAEPTEMPMSQVALTGAAGFLGRTITAKLSAMGYQVRALSRDGRPIPCAVENIATGDLCQADFSAVLADCEAVVHCAARVHVLRGENPKTAEAAYYSVNTELPVRLGEAAKAAGVRRFIQVSSAAAIASTSSPGETVTDETPPRPATPYGRSKLAADRALLALAEQRFTVACLRPPTVYGPGVGAWFALLQRAARAGLPLPLDGVRNRRSLAYSGNVAAAVASALERPLSGAWLMTDSEPVSSAELYARLLALHGHARRIFALPDSLVGLASKMVLGARASSLLTDAAFDGSRFSEAFGWAAPTPLDKALQLTVGARVQ